MGPPGFEPLVVCFCCQWCSYAAADMAGAMRLSYPPNVRIVLVPCTGRVQEEHLLAALEAGVDGVLVSGCLPGQCHYVNGNRKAEKRVARARAILEEIGEDPERIGMVHNAASMGPQLARCFRDTTERLRALGPIFPVWDGSGEPKQAGREAQYRE
ncbi:F420-non-reducing hydrogenase subunit D [Desulfacinum hydrothermale DSM 13146]|uniref:F420-non-reducing hydrogenase subunit D n=1 Tax=Desulfacinum hydrothermale DSM 13146 TaxID=1121390 RepID=A0A1W1XGB5_9BACT|nr:hydrogenase iron-sulfur subunit [Desulfacinum hydrothermale]SMC22568.1 F420-non-reducing hydrogenase subunit D [Desulfacinum hydrothermale DSM 13146]